MLIDTKLQILASTPDLLEDLLSEIPESLLKERRIEGKWSIHEHAVHLPEAQGMINERFRRFKEEQNPVFKPYLPGDTVSDDYLIDVELNIALEKFRKGRIEMITILKSYSSTEWKNEGSHPEYVKINPLLWVRHVMMHDHFHMYRIEELWLTNDTYLRKA